MLSILSGAEATFPNTLFTTRLQDHLALLGLGVPSSITLLQRGVHRYRDHIVDELGLAAWY